MKKEIQNKNGFSLIETIVAVFLITVGLIAAVDLITKGLRESIDSRDQLIAAELAQEGIELVRNIRDNNWLENLESFDHFPVGDDICRIDKSYGDIIITTTDSGIDCASSEFGLQKDSEGFFVHGAGTATKFQRKLMISEEDGGEARKIISMVSWGKDGLPADETTCNIAKKCAYTETILSKWGSNIIK